MEMDHHHHHLEVNPKPKIQILPAEVEEEETEMKKPEVKKPEMKNQLAEAGFSNPWLCWLCQGSICFVVFLNIGDCHKNLQKTNWKWSWKDSTVKL